MSSEHKFTYTSTLPLDVSWKALKRGSELLPKVLPTFFSKIEILEGDGGAGTLRVVTLGEGVSPQAVGKQVKERVDILDDATHTLVYSVIEGGDPRFTDLQNTLKFSAAGNSTSTEWTIKYTPVNSDSPPPTEEEGFAAATTKAMEAYVKDHPSEFA